MKKLVCTLLTLLCFSHLMGNDIKWNFPPVTLSSVSASASDPQVAIDANGNLAAAWVENGMVKASLKPINANWTASIALSSKLTASSPRLVSDQKGNVTVIWLENGITKAASKPFNGNWMISTALSSTGATSPALAVDADGDVVALWVRNGYIETSTKLAGQNWQGVSTIPNLVPHIAPSLAQVAIGGTGSNKTVVVVWSIVNPLTVVSNYLNIYASTKLISQQGDWTPRVIISDQLQNAGYPTIAADSNGNATAVWYSYNLKNGIYSNVTVQAASLVAGGNWESPVVLSSPGMRDPSTLIARVDYDGIGNAVAVWNTSFDDIYFTIQSAVKPVQSTWTSPTTLVDSNLYAFEADLAVSSLGDALAVYMFYNGTFLLIQSSEANFTDPVNYSWSVPINLSTGANHGYPRIAASLTGNTINAAAVWISNNGNNNIILATTGSRGVVLPPTNITVNQKSKSFGPVFTDNYNTLSWVPSSSPNVVGYVVFRNGVPIGDVAANVSQFIDDNRVPNATVTYGVAAYDNQGSQSVISTVTIP